MTDEKAKAGELKKRIRSLLLAEYESLSPDDVAGVLSGLVSELVQFSEAGHHALSEVEESGGWAASNADGGHVLDAEKDESGLVEVVASGEEAERKLLHQILDVGAVMLDLDPPPPLNEFVSLSISLPDQHLIVETQARVVHVSGKGVAVEVSGLSREDRASLDGLYRRVLAPAAAREVSHPDVEPVGQSRPIGSQTLRNALPANVSHSAADSVPIPALGPRRVDRGFRRRFDWTDPDIKVVSSSESAVGSSTREFYGPEIPWVRSSGDPERIEDLRDDRILDILLQLSQSGFTGVLEYDGGEVSRQLKLDGGLIVEISRRPRLADEELGLMLYRAERITRSQLSMAAAHADEHGGSIERSLLDLDILDPERIRVAIAGRFTFLMKEVLEWSQGSVKLFGASGLPAGFLPAPPLRVHMAVERVLFRKLFETYKQEPLAVRERESADWLEAYPEILMDEKDRVDRCFVDEGHQTLVERMISGRRRYKEVFTESNLSHADTYSVVQSLHRMGLLRFDRSMHQTIVRERYRENVTVKYLSVHKASYFEVLNVHWSSYDEVVEKAYRDLVDHFDPETVPEKMEEEVHQRVQEIRDRIESAWQVLAERETRHAYRKRIMPEYKLSHAIPLFLKQSELAERRRQWQDALDAVHRVLEIDPLQKQARYRKERLIAIIENRLSPNAADSNF